VTALKRSLVWGGALGALLLVVVVSLVAIARSDWVREQARQRIVAEAEKATNGRVEMGAFRFDWSTLTAELDHFTLHGTEAAGQAPLLSIDRLVVGFKIISLMKKQFDIARVESEGARGHIIIQPDGQINVPPPHQFQMQTLLDLKVGKLDVKDGLFLIETPGLAPREIPWNGSAKNVAAQVSYDPVKARYEGDVSVAPAQFQWDGLGLLDASVSLHAGFQKNRIDVSRGTIRTATSELRIRDVAVNNFAAPVGTGKYTARVGLDEADRIFKLINFRHAGFVDVEGEARFVSFDDYTLTGAVRGSDLSYGPLRNLKAAGKFTAGPALVALKDLRLEAMGASVVAEGEVKGFKSFALKGTMDHISVQDLTTFAGVKPLPYNGLVSGPFEATGSLSEKDTHGLVITSNATMSPAPGVVPARGAGFARFEGASSTIGFTQARIELPHSRVDFSGVPGGRLEGKLHSTDLSELRRAITLPDALKSGTVDFAGSITGPLNSPAITGHLAMTDSVLWDQKISAASGDFDASGAGITVRDGSVTWNGVTSRLSGTVGLSDWELKDSSALNVRVQIANGDVRTLLALAGNNDVPLTGALNTTAEVTGTFGDPHVSGDVALAKGEIYGEPYDLFNGRGQYLNSRTQTITGVLTAGPKRVNATARFDHGPGPDFAGTLTFDVSTNSFLLNQVVTLRKREPDLRGTGQLKAQGTVDISRDSAGQLHAAFHDLNADALAAGMAQGSRKFGDAHFTATTRNGVLTGELISNAVNAAIRADGTMQLSGDYPVEAKVSFSNLQLNAVEAMLRPSAPEHAESFEGSVAGTATLRGPARTPDLITAEIELSRLEVRPVADVEAVRNFVLRNNGPVRMVLEKSTVKVEAAHFQGPQTDVELGGSIALNQQAPLDLRIHGNVNLALAKAFNPDLAATGELVVNASVRGSYDSPAFSGRAELQKADFHYTDFVNGVTNVTGAFIFSGTRATIEKLTGESGGGKVEATGFLSLVGGVPTFRLEAKAREIRIRYPEGVSSLSDGDLTLAGTSDRSEASGKITVRRISVNPKSDAGNILAAAVEPTRTPPSKTGLLANMNLDIQIETAPDVAFETSVAQSVQADASLRLRGTATTRALLGRINVTQGEAVFFGNKYTINQGSITFLNPNEIDPILNLDLETKARGVDVLLTISGPIAKLNVSYRSDPPLQFGDIVALLATGRTPTNGTLAAYSGQSQNFQGLGASALIEQALASPSPGRLQRFFGVSKIKIDPQLSGITGSPEARLTIEQQITPNILFTYVSDVANTSTQLIRVEWDFNRRWGAILTREENGFVGLDFAFKKRFK
jgi:translocation and assembly module TamB